MKHRFLLLALAAVFAVQSCLVKDMRAPQTLFEVSDVTVPADSMASYGTGTLTVTAIVPVRSTESWSARVVDADLVPWLEIVSCDCANPAKADITGKLILTCDNNDEYASRSAKIRFVTESGRTGEITLTQKAKHNRIAIDGETSCTLKAETEESVSVKILSNTEWSVIVDPSSSLEITSVSPLTGSGDAVVTITPAANYSCKNSSTAVVNFCVADGDTAKMTIVRAADVPFMSANVVDMEQYKMPADTSGVLRFNCNCPWKAEILENNLKDFSLLQTEGEGGMQTELPFSMSANNGEKNLTAKVKLSLADNPQKNVVLTVTHRVGFTLNVDFTKVVDEESCPLQPSEAKYPQIPFNESTGLDSGSSQYDYKFVSGGKEYVFGIKNSIINVYGNFGTKSTADGYIRLSSGYIKFPAVEGYRLAYVEFTTAATDKSYTITADAEGTEVVGNKKTVGKEVLVSWDLETTEYGKAYYEIIGTSKSRQHNLILLYVK